MDKLAKENSLPTLHEQFNLQEPNANNKTLGKVAMDAIIFNYPGILNSSGQVTQAPDLLKANIALINDLLAKGYQLKNINLDGISLGAANAIALAKHFDSRGGLPPSSCFQNFSGNTQYRYVLFI